jgi:chromosome segregation ATPase
MSKEEIQLDTNGEQIKTELTAIRGKLDELKRQEKVLSDQYEAILGNCERVPGLLEFEEEPEEGEEPDEYARKELVWNHPLTRLIESLASDFGYNIGPHYEQFPDAGPLELWVPSYC